MCLPVEMVRNVYDVRSFYANFIQNALRSHLIDKNKFQINLTMVKIFIVIAKKVNAYDYRIEAKPR